MRKLWIASAVIVAIAVLILQYIAYSPKIPAPPEPCDTNALRHADYSVYRTLLEDNYSQPRIADGATIFVPETIQVSERYLSETDYRFEYISMNHERFREDVNLSRDAVDNFLRLSGDQMLLSRESFEDLPIVLTNEVEIDDVFQNKGGWSALGASMIVRFSRIGFSCDLNQALLYRSQSCGPLCGHGDLVVLELDDGEWRIVSILPLWIS